MSSTDPHTDKPPITAVRPGRARRDLPRCMAEIEGLGYEAGDEARPARRPGADFPPSFYIVGAPRCGTTALSKALGRNPRVSFSKPKETHFLVEPRPGLSDAELRDLYLQRYHRDLDQTQQAVGDGSVTYLYFPEAIERALRLDPRARFIALVRNPVDMLRSYHSRMLYQLDEDVHDFSRAWALQAERAAGRHIPKRCREPLLLQYGEIARLGARIERLFQVAGRERCLVVVFDDLVRDTRAVYTQVLAFLGVDDDGQTEFAKKRGTAGFRSPWLQQFVMNPPPWTFRFIRFSDSRMLSRLKGLRKRIKRFNTRPQEDRQELSEAMRRELREYFAGDVQRLSELISRDLSHWQ